jgi:hypothetical protein
MNNKHKSMFEKKDLPWLVVGAGLLSALLLATSCGEGCNCGGASGIAGLNVALQNIKSLLVKLIGLLR